MAEVDIGDSVFEYGQTYVALSRVQTLDGLYLSAFNPDRVRANPRVVAFYDTIKPVELTVETDFKEFELKEESDIKVVRL